ncbi:cytosolic phospholipase A2 gamma-like [Leptodactylus fuscus]
MAKNKKKTDIVYHYGDPSINTQVPVAFLRSEGELSSIKARRKKVCKALQKLKVNIPKDGKPPIIAVLGSGGGLRAMVGFLGVLSELAKEDLLKIITYICGTSGSTWCMSSLCNNRNWSSCMGKMEDQIADRILKHSYDWQKAWKKLKQAFSKKVCSLTDLWAYVFVAQVIGEINEKTLSSQQTSCENGKNPYPVYAAVEHGFLHSNQPETWFEFTPHMVGFPAYRPFIETKLLGSRFKKGKLIKEYPERDLCYLQDILPLTRAAGQDLESRTVLLNLGQLRGLWGSALADIPTIIKYIIGKFYHNK